MSDRPVSAFSQTRSPSTSGPSHAGAALAGAILFIVLMAGAISLDVVSTAGGVKGDEATYVGMALSLAYDHDLAYQRRDLDRFWGLYHDGPSGVFLKQGREIQLHLGGSPPFLHLDNTTPDRRLDRAYFGKAMLYSVCAAPFVWLLGMNGFLVFHVLLLSGVVLCGYLFLVARSRPGPALAFTIAFVGASSVTAFLVFLTSDFFNFALVFYAYFFWAYKETTAPPSRLMSGIGSDVIAAVLLGAAVYSKVSNAPLVLPLVLLPWWRGQFWRGMSVGAVSVAAAGVLFAANAAITGELNYQGGADRRQFYTDKGYPFDSPEGTWENRQGVGGGVGTNDTGAQDSFKPSEIPRLLRINATYFFLGRHFGFVPYFFPGVVAIVAWLLSQYRWERWRALTFLAAVLGTFVLLIWLPYTWSGGGGPPGNRYFMNVYPLLFFLMPPVEGVVVPLVAWAGGALFTAKILMNPFVSASHPWEITERGWARRLPVELTMARDLPLMLAQPIRGRVLYRSSATTEEQVPGARAPFVQLFFLDQKAWPPEPDGMWVSGSGRADIIVRSVLPLDHLSFVARSLVRTTVTASAGGDSVAVPIDPGVDKTFDLPTPGGARGFQNYSYLLSVRSTDGFVPRLLNPGSQDNRNLGVQLQFEAFNAPAPAAP